MEALYQVSYGPFVGLIFIAFFNLIKKLPQVRERNFFRDFLRFLLGSPLRPWRGLWHHDGVRDHFRNIERDGAGLVCVYHRGTPLV
jgi:hypothetical protein